jgi:hypothetical protein
MKTQTTLGSFISLIQTLAAEPSYDTNVAHPPQPEVVPLIPLIRFMVISWGRQMAEDRRTSCRVFRFSSLNSSSNAKASSSSSSPSTLGVLRLAH